MDETQVKHAKIIGVQLVSETDGDGAPLPVTHDADDAPLVASSRPGSKERKSPPKMLPTWYAIVILFYGLLVLGLVMLADVKLPEALNDAKASPGRFIEGRARQYLKQLTSVGPRPAGSYENEVLAVEFFKREVELIEKKAKPAHKISVDVQKPRGSFSLDFIDGLTHHYRDITNFIVKLESAEVSSRSRHALLVNCHFDSVPLTPGASDDAVSCAIMLEILAVLTQRDKPLMHNVIFLFNGAEENMLPASHGFITQHEWANGVRAFVNLEACGAGGREFVFQTGPRAPWMINAYGSVAPYPFASVVGQEIFESGVIKADTDFRIFRDYGGIPGLDIAYVKNGYVYHTKYDNEEAIPAGSIQRAGDNVLAVVSHIADSDQLAHQDAQDNSHVVFFDVLGIFLISYPEWGGIFINLAAVTLSLYTTYMKVQKSHEYGVDKKTFLRYMLFAFGYHLAGAAASFFSVILIATVIDAFGSSMSWYGRPYLIIFLYISPTIFSVAAVFNFASFRQKKVFAYVKGLWSLEVIYTEVSKVCWSLLCLVGTLLRVQSSFICMLWVLFPTLGRILLDKMYDSGLKRKEKDFRWLCIHLLSLLPPLIMGLVMFYSTFVMFIPIMGRAGPAVNPDILIGCIAVCMTLASISYVCPLVMVLQNPNALLTTLLLATKATMILVCATRLGFPYSGDPNSLAPHRAFALHTEREFYNRIGELKASDSGYWIVNLDRNSPKKLMDHVPEMYAMEEVSQKQCESFIFCGMPLYYPAHSLLPYNHWIPANKPNIYRKTSMELVTSEESGRHKRKLLFRVNGPDHMAIFLSPAVGVEMSNWSFEGAPLQPGPQWKDDRPTYFVFYSHGLNPKQWEFWVELKVPKTFVDGEDDLLDASVVGHFIHGQEMKSTADFKRFLSQYPSWSYVTGWTSSLRYYRF